MLTAKEKIIIGMKLIKEGCILTNLDECEKCPLSEHCYQLELSPDNWDIKEE